MAHAPGAPPPAETIKTPSPTDTERDHENPGPAGRTRLHRPGHRGLRRNDRHGADARDGAPGLGRAVRHLRPFAPPRHRDAARPRPGHARLRLEAVAWVHRGALTRPFFLGALG